MRTCPAGVLVAVIVISSLLGSSLVSAGDPYTPQSGSTALSFLSHLFTPSPFTLSGFASGIQRIFGPWLQPAPDQGWFSQTYVAASSQSTAASTATATVSTGSQGTTASTGTAEAQCSTSPIYASQNQTASWTSLSVTSAYTVTTTASTTTTTSTASTAQASTPPTYTVLNGSEYAVEDSLGKVVLSGYTDFGSLFNALNSLLNTGDTVRIGSGVFVSQTDSVLAKTRIMVIGSSGTVIRHGSDLGDAPLFEVCGTNNTIQNIDFDGNFLPYKGVNVEVCVEGEGNTITHCTLDNCTRYGFAAWDANDWKITYCTVNKAQYGISGGDGDSTHHWASNGIVANNTIRDCLCCGIKMKMWRNVLVIDNHVDVGLQTWGTSANNGWWGTYTESNGCAGIRFYNEDCPTQNVTVEANVIVDSVRQEHKGIGIFVDQDLHLDWTDSTYDPARDASYGERILNNTVLVPFYGMIIEGNGVYAMGNDCTTATVGGWGIRVDGDNCQITGNSGYIQIVGNYNTLTGNSVPDGGKVDDLGAGNVIT